MLRKLSLKDKDAMLEWMKDPLIACYFRFDPASVTEQKVNDFINESLNDRQNLHFAIVDETDEYLGTISLKNIDSKNRNAEYAISLRQKAIGRGIARDATTELLLMAFNEYNLNKVYLNVISTNVRAVRFYEKYGFSYEGEFVKHIEIDGEFVNLKWFAIFKEQMQNR